MLRKRFEHRNRELGIRSTRLLEVFTVTAWGRVPACEQVLTDLPNVLPEVSNLPSLRDRLARWQGDGVEARTPTSA